jgi:hypothetical protein
VNGTKQYSKFQLFVITYLSARELIENPKALREAENRVRMSIQEFSEILPGNDDKIFSELWKLDEDRILHDVGIVGICQQME